jgi:DNA-binding transcriptional LysR family regulator
VNESRLAENLHSCMIVMRICGDARVSLDWDNLKIALALGRVGSLTRAADMLGVDQSTAGRRLAALEAALGTVLFERSRAGLTPTEAGEAAIARAIEIESRVERLTDDLSRGPDGPAGLVRIVGESWVLERLAGAPLAGFLTRHPRLEVRIVAGAGPRARGGEATVSLWFETPPRELDFAIRLGEVPYALYARRDLDPERLDWVGFLDETTPRQPPARLRDRLRRPDERVVLTANDPRPLVAAVAAGIGRGLLPTCLAEERPELRRLRHGAPDLLRPLHVHLHPDTVQMQRVQATLAWLRGTVRELAETAAAPTAA